MKILELFKTIDQMIITNTDRLNNYLLFIVLLIVIFTTSFLLSFTSVAIGGLLLIIGALYIYIGNVFFSVISYTFADICWLINAYNNGDLFGAISVTIGIIVGFVVTQKMQFGVFSKKI
ncbi:MAG: hypothetical protein WC136_00420 [Sphaerochaeta sp.]|jgi:hypothetical protein